MVVREVGVGASQGGERRGELEQRSVNESDEGEGDGGLFSPRSLLIRDHPPPPLALPSPIPQISLITDEHDAHIPPRILPRLLQPSPQMIKSVPPSNIVNQKRPSRPPIITPSNTPKALLPRRVPYLQLNRAAVDRDHAGTELHPYSQIMDRLKTLVGELEEEAGLADACVADYDVLSVKFREC